MKNYKIAFVGLGSMGRRHMKDAAALLSGRGDSYTIDVYRSSLSHPVPEDIAQFVSCEHLLNDTVTDVPEDGYDIVFITNPTANHYDTLKKFLPAAKAIFLEKPVFDDTSYDLSALTGLSSTVCYVACPLRYNPVLEYVRSNINTHEAISARAISSSYLPDWRPGTDYRKCYSARRDMGGGVGIDLIHEWDYLTELFGHPNYGYSIQLKNSGLEIDSDDTAVYIAKTPTTTLELHLDYFGRKSIRTLEIYMPDDTIRCDLLAGTIDYLFSGRHEEVKVSAADVYMKELVHFMDIADGFIENDNTVENALITLSCAKGEF